MNSPDHPDLTAYALGELDAEHAEAMSRWLAENPEAGVEVDALHELSQRLQSTAPVSLDLLHPHQRATVLSGPQKVRQMVAAATAPAPRRKPSLFVPIAYSVSRIAAAAALIIGGYIAGTHVATSKSSSGLARATPAPAAKGDNSAPVVVPPFKAKEVPQMVSLPAPAEAQPQAQASALVAEANPLPTPEITVVAALDQPKDARVETEKMVVATAPVLTVAVTKETLPKFALPKTQVLTDAFVSATKTALAQVNLHPAESRYTAPRSSEPVAAAPLVSAGRTSEAVPHGKQPELLIHSWKAEVASCPWNPAHRLLRLAIQMPSEQPASIQSGSYPLQVNFSANHVRNYRQICQRVVPAAAVDAPAFHVVWYEFLPNGQATEGASKLIGSVTLPGARFTTPASGPFDSSKLQVVDRGADWNSARDDFLFESAVVGFGLLLKGEKDAGSLDHSLVLDLARRTVEADRTGERARFVKVVQDAQRSAGL